MRRITGSKSLWLAVLLLLPQLALAAISEARVAGFACSNIFVRSTLKRILFALIALGPMLAHAGAAIDTTHYLSEANTAATGNTYTTTGSLTVTSSSNAIVCSPWAWNGGGVSASSYSTVTWGGVSLTKLVSATNESGVNLDLWYLLSPTAGTHTLTATTPNTLTGFQGMLCVPVNNVDVSSGATSAFATAAAAFNDIGGSITVTATGSAGANDLYFGAAQVNGSSITSTGTGQTRIGTAQINTVSEDQIAGTGGGVFAWTNSGSSNNAVAIALAIHGTAGGQPAPTMATRRQERGQRQMVRAAPTGA